MKQLSACVLIFSSLFISAKLQRVQKLIFKDAHDNRSEYNEVYFHPKKQELYRHKSSDVSKNYLNYRDVYGIRYTPQRKEVEKNASEIANNLLITTLPASIESEGISPLSNESIMESTTLHGLRPHQQQQQQQQQQYLDSEHEEEGDREEEQQQQQQLEANSVHDSNDDIEITEQDAGETNTHHIMKPNNRVEHALNFLAHRMKNLMYISSDNGDHQNHRVTEANVSPHLLSLGKFLNLFSLIRVDSVPCMSGRKPLRQLYGSCLNEAECLNLGGISMDRCANGFGVCCIFKASCGHVSHHNVTYFESPNYPLASETNLGSCTLTVLLARNVKQVLLEFVFFEILPPTNGNCIDDQFMISTEAGSKAHEVPIICGIASGQHMYVDVANSEKLFLSILTHTADDRAFSIKVTQLTVHDVHGLAPDGCLQFYTEDEGTLKSFNYDNDYSQIIKYRNPTYFNNMNYAICIRRHSDHCVIKYTNELKGREEIFELVNLDAKGDFLAQGQAGAEIFSCPDDFIAVNYIRLCGYKLNDGAVSINFNINVAVRSNMNGPIVIPVKTNNATVGRGFKIHYFQEKC